MYAVSYSRTMANAKPKFREPEPKPVSIDLLRKIRRERQEAAEKAARLAEEKERERQREEAIAAAKARAEIMREFAGSTRYKPTMATIANRISRATGISVDLIRSSRRNREIVIARQAVMYWTARLTTLSYPQMARLLGGKDHTTVLHAKDAYPEKRAKMGRYLRPVR